MNNTQAIFFMHTAQQSCVHFNYKAYQMVGKMSNQLSFLMISVTLSKSLKISYSCEGINIYVYYYLHKVFQVKRGEGGR